MDPKLFDIGDLTLSENEKNSQYRDKVFPISIFQKVPNFLTQ